MTVALYGHPFSSYTWKVQIALHASDIAHGLQVVDPDHPEHAAFVDRHGGPLGKFPVLVDGAAVVFESTSIIEHLARHHPGAAELLPGDAEAAIAVRTLDRVFDNYVMSPMQVIVDEHLSNPAGPDPRRCAHARARLERSYGWLENWLADYRSGGITLVECAAAPALFYADLVCRIDGRWPRLAAWRARLNALPAVAACIEAARPYRGFFPPGAPDRD